MTEDNLENLAFDDDVELIVEGVDFESFKRLAREELSPLSPNELAKYFIQGSEDHRIIYRDFLSTRPKEYQNEFRSHLEDLSKHPSQSFSGLSGKTPVEVAERFLDIPFSVSSDSARMAIREYVERQPQEFVDQFNSYILSKTQPIREELARTSGDYELDCA
ncbi:hypothetical protein J4422_03120 [Candidatus Pacearchaeota archaeon]|nr:hypothetical protein [Candidatus Pacearchaeota archaeon]